MALTKQSVKDDGPANDGQCPQCQAPNYSPADDKAKHAGTCSLAPKNVQEPVEGALPPVFNLGSDELETKKKK